jgi:hypothetical protein
MFLFITDGMKLVAYETDVRKNEPRALVYKFSDGRIRIMNQGHWFNISINLTVFNHLNDR